nr:hypothetical protein [Caballeronia terrestris]
MRNKAEQRAERASLSTERINLHCHAALDYVRFFKRRVRDDRNACKSARSSHGFGNGKAVALWHFQIQNDHVGRPAQMGPKDGISASRHCCSEAFDCQRCRQGLRSHVVVIDDQDGDGRSYALKRSVSPQAWKSN